MHKAEHEERCIKVLGKPFSEVHTFLDQFFRTYGGLPHRLILHHRLGIELIGVMMGPDAALAAKQHVLDDMGRLPAGPEEHMGRHEYMPSRYEFDVIRADMERMLGYVPDFPASYEKLNRNLKCSCGYPGPMIRFRKFEQDWQFTCPWCQSPLLVGQQNELNPSPDTLSKKFDVLRELTVGHRFREGLPEELRALFL